MQRPEAYPITYGVLGLLAISGPMSGYDLKQRFDHILAPMWGATHSQIYNELRRMKELGWVEMEREEQESRPDRKVYSITESGYEALAAWQAQPPSVLQLRDELLLKILFGTFSDPEALANNIRRGIVEHEGRLQRYRQNLQLLSFVKQPPEPGKRHNPYAASGEEDPYFRLISHFAIAYEKTYLESLYEILEFVEKGEHEEK
ncbi:MAG: PadR family transcriptional regulator [Ktedonobacteraceae bacterium]|nr:PadR family transcriptional regulator [Ktedonobacteraceae bacterium]